VRVGRALGIVLSTTDREITTTPVGGREDREGPWAFCCPRPTWRPPPHRLVGLGRSPASATPCLVTWRFGPYSWPLAAAPKRVGRHLLSPDDRLAGFDWSFSIAQLEVSDTACPTSHGAPTRARPEAAVGSHLDLGRPEKLSLVVDRTVVNKGRYRSTPGPFATEVITPDIVPAGPGPESQGRPEGGQGPEGVETTVNNPADLGLRRPPAPTTGEPCAGWAPLGGNF
jgi:hypothetical protein